MRANAWEACSSVIVKTQGYLHGISYYLYKLKFILKFLILEKVYNDANNTGKPFQCFYCRCESVFYSIFHPSLSQCCVGMCVCIWVPRPVLG